ncbi:TPA: tyrosine-type recombinase/integrase [Enterobacter cloacae]|nr:MULTISPECIES: tyrosine-type recombinase/integrase [Enterobacter cloacae complex]KPU03848.1 hypothetical protein AN697_16175 [Enterobacter cloacae subsp. cloacae]MCE1547216.1 integrase family protein [Enterobacter hormaechei]HBM2451795.1 integrase family protein [Enterobacter hormaechei]
MEALKCPPDKRNVKLVVKSSMASLNLIAYPTGKKSWWHRGKPADKKLGDYPAMTYKQAIEAQVQLVQALTEEKLNPSAVAGAQLTIGQLFEQWCNDGERKLVKPRTADDIAKTWLTYMRLELADLPAATFSPDDARSFLRRVRDGQVKRPDSTRKNDQTIYRTATVRAHGVLRGMYKWAVNADKGIKSSPMMEVALDMLITKRVKLETKRTFSSAITAPVIDGHEGQMWAGKARASRYLAVEELRQLWAALVATDHPCSHAVQLILLTGVRVSEAAGCEVDHIATAGRIRSQWSIPAGQLKNHMALKNKDVDAFRIHLSEPARAIMQHALGHLALPRRYVFQSYGKRLDKQVRAYPRTTDSIGIWLNKFRVKHMPDAAPFSCHDLRRTFSTLSVKHLRGDREIIERCLNHETQSAVGNIYTRDEALPLQADHWEQWQQWLVAGCPVESDNVLPFGAFAQG